MISSKQKKSKRTRIFTILVFSQLCAYSIQPTPARIWNFNQAPESISSGHVFLDLAVGEVVTLRGNGASVNGTEIILSSNPTLGNNPSNLITSYLDLPNGIVSSRTSSSFELWLKPLSSVSYQRIFDFGRSSSTSGNSAELGEIVDSAVYPGRFQGYQNIVLTLNNETTLGQHVFGYTDGMTQFGSIFGYLNTTNLSSTSTIGNKYHYVMTINDAANGNSCTVKWYRDGIFYSQFDLPYSITKLPDVNNWIGRSMWGTDKTSHISIDELRIYDRAMDVNEIQASFIAGPNNSFAAPICLDDSAQIHPNHKVLIDVLSNDQNNPLASTLEISTQPSSGHAVVKAGKILYSHSSESSDPISFHYRVKNISGNSSQGKITISLVHGLRLTNAKLAMPSQAPASNYKLVDGLTGLTFHLPICIASSPNSTKRLYVAERSGKIQLVPDISDPNPTKQIFIDLKASIAERTPTESLADWWFFEEGGLLGLAFHPNYATNGYFFVSYTVHISGNFYQRISKFKVSSNNPDVADPNSEEILIQQLDRGSNHNGGDIHFSPTDGYLYYAAGDEENSSLGILNSQKLTDGFFAGIFRIDVDKKPGNLEPNAHASIPTKNGLAKFSIPIDNPYVHNSIGGTWSGEYNGSVVSPLASVRMEYWATGLRHVWRMSFDSQNGDLWAGDVGQNVYEEINRITKGGNYGWGYRDGAHDLNGILGTPPSGFSSIDPFYEYLHTNISGSDQSLKGNSVLGGYIYRGSRISDLYGKYIFSDSLTGHIWSLNPTTSQVMRIAGLPGAYGIFSTQGVDPNNNDLLFAEYNNGKIMRLVNENPSNSRFPYTLSQTGLFSDLSDLSPAPGLIAYEPNLSFWSDHAHKMRWFTIPNENDKMTWNKNENWTFPEKTLWVKHFDLETIRGDSSSKKRLETRILVKTETGSYGVSYRWNDQQNEAFLVSDNGDEFDVTVNVNGVEKLQRWQIPSRTSCLTCHTPQAGHALSFNTAQLNKSYSMSGFIGNQLTSLSVHGFLSNTPDNPSTLRRYIRPNEEFFTLEERVRSYLSVNCSYCHQSQGTANGSWDGRHHIPLEDTKLIHSADDQTTQSQQKKYIIPGQVENSHLMHRLTGSSAFTRMPPLGSNELDLENIQLLTEWISSELPHRHLYESWQKEYFSSSDSNSAKALDADGDGMSNYQEYLLGSNPIGGTTTSQVTLHKSELTFNHNAFRYYSIETSRDLVKWQRFENPATDYKFKSFDTQETISLPNPINGKIFFRLHVSEP